MCNEFTNSVIHRKDLISKLFFVIAKNVWMISVLF